MNKLQYLLKKYSPLVLTTIGSVGVVVTSVLTAKATIKAKKLIEDVEEDVNYKLCFKDDWQDIIKIAWKPYIPAIISGISTISCIYGAHFLNRKTQASLVSAYAFLNNSYKEYVEKSKEVYGEDAENKIKEAIAKSKYQGINHEIDGETRLFFDYQSMQYFESTFDKIKKAENFVNQEFAASGYVHLSVFYDYLGLEGYGNLDSLGWCSFDDYYEIEFEHQRVVMDDGLECWIITCTPPADLYFL